MIKRMVCVEPREVDGKTVYELIGSKGLYVTKEELDSFSKPFYKSVNTAIIAGNVYKHPIGTYVVTNTTTYYDKAYILFSDGSTDLVDKDWIAEGKYVTHINLENRLFRLINKPDHNNEGYQE